MERLRTPAARFLLALGLLAWIGVTWADQLHAYLVVHAICPDHGEIVELAHGHGHVLSPHDGVSIGKADVSSEHDHGCASLLCQLDMALASKSQPPPTSVRPLISRPQWPTAAPRGPPLAWAPKTSPPRAS